MVRRIRGILQAGIALGLLAACAGGEGGEPSNDAAPSTESTPSATGLIHAGKDLILVSVDTLRADRLPEYGAERPTSGDPEQPWSLAWMARQGTVLERVYAPVGITLPSLATMWTGEYPLVHGALTNHSRVELPTFAMEMVDQGWTGLAAVSSGILRDGAGLQRGFQEYLAFPGPAEHKIPARLLESSVAPIAAGERLLLWTHLVTPHQPYDPPPRFAQQYTTADGPPGTNKTLFGIHLDPTTLTPEVDAHLKGLYDAEILESEEYLRLLLAGLDEQYRAAGRGGLLDNAVVIFTSDHGEELGDRHGFYMHAKSLYRGVTQVPTWVLGDGWQAGRDDRLMGLGELLPWVLHGTPPSGEPVVSALKEKFYALRDDRWTLIHSPAGSGASPGGPPQGSLYPYPAVALFDRHADPDERVDVSADHPERTRQMLDHLRAWHAALPIAGEQENREVDAAIIESLGYAGLEEEIQDDTYPPPWRGADWDPE